MTIFLGLISHSLPLSGQADAQRVEGKGGKEEQDCDGRTALRGFSSFMVAGNNSIKYFQNCCL